MKQPEEFDAFYRDARERLLLQTYAMTGDLAASRRAVRDAFVVAWHRWRKLQRLEDPEQVVRPHAWRLAQRRHTARVWHREKDIDPGVRATLEALGRLPVAQRRALVLTQCASVTMAQMAREVGLTPERAAAELQSGAAQLALLREVQTAALPALFAALAASLTDQVRWPRGSIVRRAGATRRRTHTLAGVLGAVATVAVAGTLVTDTGTAAARPTLDRPAAPRTHTRALAAVAVPLPATSLLSTSGVVDALGGRGWTAGRTTDNSGGSGSVLPCQTARYADPGGKAALVRTFRTAAGRTGPSVTQFSEASADAAAGRSTYAATTGWFADCATDRVQLLATRTPVDVGDDAVQLVLRSWDDPVTTYVVGVARSGVYTTTTVTRQVAGRSGPQAPDAAASAALLAAAVRGVCDLPDGGACASTEPRVTTRAPLPTGSRPAMLAALDLPPVPGVEQPWAGSPPESVTPNLAATACDRTRFTGAVRGATFAHARSRTFLVTGADLPPEFGLTETVAALPATAARAFVDGVRSRVAACPDRSLGSTVTRVVDRHDATTAVAVWKVSVEVTDEQRVDYLMAVVRDGTAVAQLGFVPSGRATLDGDTFTDLAQRALARLGELPAPGA